MGNYNVGIIGYGWAAGTHIDAINGTTRGTVTAVCSSRNLDPADLEKTHDCPIEVYNKVEDLLADIDIDIDIVDITSFPSQHKDQAIAAAEADKNVILEKPITLNLEDAKAIEAAFEKNGTKSCVCFEVRFLSQFTTTKGIIDQGLLGDLHYAEGYGQFRWNTTKENGGSSLLSAGCHAMDALMLCMGNDVEEVTSYATFSKNADMATYEYPTTSTTIVKFANGSVRKCASVIDCIMPYCFHTHLCGSEGSLLGKQALLHQARLTRQSLDRTPHDDGRLRRRPRPSLPRRIPGLLRLPRQRRSDAPDLLCRSLQDLRGRLRGRPQRRRRPPRKNSELR